MSATPIRPIPISRATWVETEVVTADGDLRVHGAQLAVSGPRRLVHVASDDNAGTIGHYWSDLRIPTVTDLGLFDPITVVADTTPIAPIDPPTVIDLAVLSELDDLRRIAGISLPGDRVLAEGPDRALVGGATSRPARELLIAADMPAGDPFAAFGDLRDHWDFSTLTGLADGATITTVPNRVGSSPLGAMLAPAGSEPTWSAAAFGTGRGGAVFSGTKTMTAGSTDSALQLQPFTVVLAVNISAISNTTQIAYGTGGNTGSAGSPADARNSGRWDTATGWYIYAGGTSKTLKGGTATAGKHSFLATHAGQESRIRVDGVDVATTPTGTVGQSSRQYMQINQAGLAATVGRVLVYAGPMTGIDLPGLEAALRAAHALP